MKLFQGSNIIPRLIKTDPFKGKRPEYVRILKRFYNFTSDWAGEAWWQFKKNSEDKPVTEIFLPEISLKDLGDDFPKKANYAIHPW